MYTYRSLNEEDRKIRELQNLLSKSGAEIVFEEHGRGWTAMLLRYADPRLKEFALRAPEIYRAKVREFACKAVAATKLEAAQDVFLTYQLGVLQTVIA